MTGLQRAIAGAEASYRAGAYAPPEASLQPLSHLDAPPADVLGLRRLRQGAPAAALARALAPADPWARLHHGVGLQAAGRYAEAADAFRACMPLLPDAPAPALNLSTALLALGKIDAAIHAAAAPGCARPICRRPITRWARPTSPAGRPARPRRRRLRRGHAPRAPLRRSLAEPGVALYRTGAIEPAKQAMRAAIAADPANQAAAANLGGFLRLTGEVEAADTPLRDCVARGACPGRHRRAPQPRRRPLAGGSRRRSPGPAGWPCAG